MGRTNDRGGVNIPRFSTQRLKIFCAPAICSLALHFLATGDAAAQGTILHATVADARTGVYILDAEVTVDPIGLKGTTDYFGDARFPDLREGRYTVHARRLGYAPLSADVQLSGTDSLEVTLMMAPAGHELAPVTVEATLLPPYLKEFEARRRLGKGQFVTDTELRSALGSSLGDILTSRLRGVIVGRTVSGAIMVRSNRGPDSFQGPCAAAVYWNGVRLTSRQSPAIDIPVNFIGGIEYYNPGTIPVEYQDPGSNCGVLLLWPRP